MRSLQKSIADILTGFSFSEGDKSKDKRKSKKNNETQSEPVDEDTRKRREEINDLLRRRRLQGAPAVSRPQNQMSNRSQLESIPGVIQPSLSQNPMLTKDVDTISNVPEDAANSNTDPEKSANRTTLGDGVASAHRPSTPGTTVPQSSDSPQRTHSSTASVSSTAEQMQSRPVSTLSFPRAARSNAALAMRYPKPAHGPPNVGSSIAGPEIGPMTPVQSTVIRRPPTDVQTQAAEPPQSQLESGDVRKENPRRTYTIPPNNINAGIGSQFSKTSGQKAEDGQMQWIGMKPDSMKSTEITSERATNETDDHEDQHDHAPHCGTTDSPPQDIVVRQANLSTNYHTSKASPEHDPRLLELPTVPTDDPTMANGTLEGNPNVNKGKGKATLVLA